ncbi:MAG TPA: protein kinase [Candidatus Polarisedimenticolia bacterium]|jgi:hypothetical protein|nr:protein kinase [Candidatus Polarisedimenticolia bacterium]
MSLPAGLRLGPYELVAPLGAGGMGEVYRARDTRLQRTVAIKVLPEKHAAGPGARERFEREAKAISQLSHPHICALYDLGRHEGLDYLVLEFLEGETLASRLARGPLPIDEALRFGSQIAAALGAAHRNGIVHRDLKPGNVMLTRSGMKLLDFGLAKPVSGSAFSDSSQTPTRTELTQEGTVPGTVPYMAPEQIEAGTIDTRTDIFALGAVLHEMVTGKRAFEGRSTASLMAAILERDPAPLGALRPEAPAGLDHLVRVCLAKQPDERWQSADDVSRELAWIARGDSGASARTASRRLPGTGMAGAAVALLAAGALAGWLAARAALPASPPSAGGSIQRLTVVLPDGAPLAPPTATPFSYPRAGLAVSPDDSRIAYVSSEGDGVTRIMMRRADQFEPAPIAGTEGGFDPFFSPDGRWLGFFTFDTVRKVSVDGGAPLSLAAVLNAAGGTWCDDGTIYVSGDEGRSLWKVGAAGAGRAERIDLVDPAAQTSYPHCLPGSHALLVTMVATDNPARHGEPGRFLQPLTADLMSVGILDLPVRGKGPRALVAHGYAPQYAASGQIVFARSGTIMAAAFDLGRGALAGPEAAVASGVSMCSIAVPSAQFSLTSAGSLFDVPGVDQARTRLVWVDRQGRITPTAAAPDLFGSIRLSPDGRRALVEVGGLQDDVYVYDLADGRRTRITSDGKSGRRGLWNPDGRRVIFYSHQDHRWVMKPVDSDIPPEALAIDGFFTSWSPAGTLAGELDGHIWTGTLDRHPSLTGAGNEWGAQLSPDGSLLAYTSSRAGIFQVFAQPIPPTGREWQLSADFGEEPVWSRDSRELFYRKHDQWWSVSFAGGQPGPPRLLFRGAFFNALGPSYDVAPDGRFLVAQTPAAGPIRELRWTRNWTSEVRSVLAAPR